MPVSHVTVAADGKCVARNIPSTLPNCAAGCGAGGTGCAAGSITGRGVGCGVGHGIGVFTGGRRGSAILCDIGVFIGGRRNGAVDHSSRIADCNIGSFAGCRACRQRNCRHHSQQDRRCDDKGYHSSQFHRGHSSNIAEFANGSDSPIFISTFRRISKKDPPELQFLFSGGYAFADKGTSQTGLCHNDLRVRSGAVIQHLIGALFRQLCPFYVNALRPFKGGRQ